MAVELQFYSDDETSILSLKGLTGIERLAILVKDVESQKEILIHLDRHTAIRFHKELKKQISYLKDDNNG